MLSNEAKVILVLNLKKKKNEYLLFCARATIPKNTSFNIYNHYAYILLEYVHGQCSS